MQSSLQSSCSFMFKTPFTKVESVAWHCYAQMHCRPETKSKGVTQKVGTIEEMRNGKWANGKKVHCSKLLMFCYCSHQMWWGSQCPSMHSLKEHLPDSWHQRGMQRHCIIVCKLAQCICCTILAACQNSWSFLNLWIVHSSFQLDTRLCSCLHCYMDIHTFFSHIYSTLVLFNILPELSE